MPAYTIVRMGIKDEMCILSHEDERGKTITTELTVNGARVVIT